MNPRHYMRFGIAAAICAISASPQTPGQTDSGIQVYQNTLKSTVWIHSNRGGGRAATGSGSLIDRRRCLILTNYHVVGNIREATVHFPDFHNGKVIAERDHYRRKPGIEGQVMALDRQADLAIIQLRRVPDGAQALSLAPGSPEPGQTVHSIGNPGGSGALWVYTPGKVRQVYHKRWEAELDGRRVTFEAQVVETDSATNPGDSGGPLVNDKVELVGVTQGGAINAQLLSVFVDVTEVQRFLNTQRVRDIAPVGGDQETTRAGFPVKDDGKFFSPDTIAKANQQIKLIAHKYGRDLLIETYQSVPPDDAARVRGMSAQEKEKYFHDWAQRRSGAQGSNGVTILICRNPTYLYVNVSKEAKSDFDEEAAQQLRKMLLEKFRERKYDEGLLAAVKMVADKLAERNP